MIGTNGGAAWFDGASFVAAEQGPPDGVFGIVENPENVFWFSGGGGIWRYDAANADWRVFSSQTGDLTFYGVFAGGADVSGNVYFGTPDDGLLRIAPNFQIDYWKIPNQPRGGAFAGILQTPGGELVFQFSDASKVDVFNPGTGFWSRPERDWPGFPVYFDASGRLWLNEWPTGVWIVDQDGQETHITDRQGLPGDAFVNDVVVAGDGTAWLATSQGLAHFDGTQVVEVITATQMGLAEGEIKRVFFTSDGTLWVTTYSAMARRPPGGSWETLGTNNPFRDDYIGIYDLAESPEAGIWLATSSGAYHYFGGEWSLVTYGDPNVKLPSAAIRSVSLAPDGSVWFGTDRGAARFDGSGWQSFGVGPDGLIHGEVNDILVTATGEVFFATSGGVTRLQP
jgi:ligand-binding sensor domain-containing protein